MMQLLIKYGNIVPTTTTGHRLRYPLYLLLLLRQAGYIVNFSDFYSSRLIGKLTDFLQLQEFSLRKHNVVCSTSAAPRSQLSSLQPLLVASFFLSVLSTRHMMGSFLTLHSFSVTLFTLGLLLFLFCWK